MMILIQNIQQQLDILNLNKEKIMYYNIKNSPKAWYNKFGIYKIYEETELKDSWFHISLVSHDREDDIAKGTNNFLTLAFGSTYKKFILPFQLIKPIFDYNSYDYDGDDYYQKSRKWFQENNIPVKYKFYKPKEYKFYISDSAICIELATAEDGLLYNEGNYTPLFDRLYWIPWKCTSRTKEQLLNLDGTVYFDTKDGDWDAKYEKEKSQEFEVYVVEDYDNAQINVECRRSYSEYSLGSNRFWKLLFKPFVKTRCYHYLNIEFKEEFGKNKGSWKGGIVSTSIEMLSKDEPFEDALTRFGCNERNPFILVGKN